jgi:hypothetical protein
MKALSFVTRFDIALLLCIFVCSCDAKSEHLIDLELVELGMSKPDFERLLEPDRFGQNYEAHGRFIRITYLGPVLKREATVVASFDNDTLVGYRALWTSKDAKFTDSTFALLTQLMVKRYGNPDQSGSEVSITFNKWHDAVPSSQNSRKLLISIEGSRGYPSSVRCEVSYADGVIIGSL